MEIWNKYEKTWKSLESLETEDSLFSVNCVLYKGPGVFVLGESFWLTISPGSFAAICLFAGRWFASCFAFTLGARQPHIRQQTAEHFFSCAWN
jgi:hypothetical protein